MKLDQYPPQEPLSEVGRAYAARCMDRYPALEEQEFQYGPDVYQSLLVFAPQRPDGRVLLFWHGGGWTSGYKEWMAFMAPALVDAGITFVSAGYRLAPQHLFPVGVQDAALAVKWVWDNIGTLGADPACLFLGGHSAGGHYAAWLAVMHAWREQLGLPADVVKGCLPISGVYDLTAAGGLSMRPRFLGPVSNENEASPIHHVRWPLPPFLLAHGSNDFPHLSRQAEQFEAALRTAGGTASRLVLEQCDHFDANLAAGDADGVWFTAAQAFMRKHARNGEVCEQGE